MNAYVGSATRAKNIVDGISGDRISSEMTPVVLAQLLEAQVFATLAVAAAIEALRADLEFANEAGR